MKKHLLGVIITILGAFLSPFIPVALWAVCSNINISIKIWIVAFAIISFLLIIIGRYLSKHN